MGNTTEERAENTFSVDKNVDLTLLDDKELIPEDREEAADKLQENIPDHHDFMELFEENLKSIHEGKVVKGEIVQIDKEFVLVDIGYKSEGQIRIAEFTNPRGGLTARVGDEVDVVLVLERLVPGRPGMRPAQPGPQRQ